MFPVRPRGQPAEAEFGLSGDQPYSSAIPTPKDPCYKVDPEPPPGAGGQKIGSAWSNDGCANILNSDRYREQSRASALSDYAGAASGYSGKLQAYAHLVAANSLHSPPHPQRARDAILMISASRRRCAYTHNSRFRPAAISKMRSWGFLTERACAKSAGPATTGVKMNNGAAP